MAMNRAEEARFHRNYRVSPDGCWPWVGPVNRDGYGRHRIAPGQPERPAHLISYEEHVGPILAGMQIDHVCHTRAVREGTCSGGPCRHRRCVNPDHLEQVTPSENTLRQDHAERRVTHCPRNHPYPPDQRDKDGKRRCKECDRERKRLTRHQS